MADSQGLTFVDKESVWYLGTKDVVELKDVTARIILLLKNQNIGLSGAQLARKLNVTPSAITKAVKQLLRLQIIRRESLPVSPNVKLYTLVVKVMNDEDFEEIRRKTSPTLLKILAQNLAGNEKMALFYAGKMNQYLKSLPQNEAAGVMRKVVQEISGHEIKDEA